MIFHLVYFGLNYLNTYDMTPLANSSLPSTSHLFGGKHPTNLTNQMSTFLFLFFFLSSYSVMVTTQRTQSPAFMSWKAWLILSSD